MEPAASQIVSKALRFITGDATPPPPRPSRAPANFDSQSFLDKVRSVGWAPGGWALEGWVSGGHGNGVGMPDAP